MVQKELSNETKEVINILPPEVIQSVIMTMLSDFFKHKAEEEV